MTASEDLWIRHARMKPTCTQLLLDKGPSFINETLENFGRLGPTLDTRDAPVSISSSLLFCHGGVGFADRYCSIDQTSYGVQKHKSCAAAWI